MSSPVALAGYAMLRANYNAGSPNYLDNFVEFIIDAVRVQNPHAVQPAAASKHVAEKFGIAIPVLVAENILKRALRLNRLSGSVRTGFTCTRRELSHGQAVGVQYDTFVRQQNQLAERLVAFAQDGEFADHRSLSADEASTLIATYMDAQALPLLRSVIKGIPAPQRLDSGENYLVSCFVAQAETSDPDIFNKLVEVAKGATLAALLRTDVSSLSASLKNVSIYLDAPLLVDVLGHHGGAAKAASLELVELARGLGARVRVFRHTVREVEAILDAAENFLRSGRQPEATFRAAVYFIESGSSPADVRLAREQIDVALRDLDIHVRPKPDNYTQYGLDESALEESLQREIHYFNRVAREYDADSIAAVHMLRAGGAGPTLERAKSVFVSGNWDVVRVANQAREVDGEFPLALLDSTLASLLWVRSPTLAADLPAKKISASAWAGMSPSQGVWIQYLAEVDRLEADGSLKPEDAILLRYAGESRRELMREVAGDEQAIAAVPPSQLVERVKGELAGPLKTQLEDLQAQVTANGRAADDAVAAAEGETESLRAELQREQELKAQRRDAVIARATDAARKRVGRVLWGTFILLALLIVGSSVASKLLPETSPIGTVATWTFSVLAAVAIVLALAWQLDGRPVRAWLEPVESRLAEQKVRRALIAAGFETKLRQST